MGGAAGAGRPGRGGAGASSTPATRRRGGSWAPAASGVVTRGVQAPAPQARPTHLQADPGCAAPEVGVAPTPALPLAPACGRQGMGPRAPPCANYPLLALLTQAHPTSTRSPLPFAPLNLLLRPAPSSTLLSLEVPGFCVVSGRLPPSSKDSPWSTWGSGMRAGHLPGCVGLRAPLRPQTLLKTACRTCST